jgi:hypothetical protein
MQLPWISQLLLQSKRMPLPFCTFAICLDTGWERLQIVSGSLSIRVPILHQTFAWRANASLQFPTTQSNNSKYKLGSNLTLVSTGSLPINTYDFMMTCNITIRAVLQHFRLCIWCGETCLQKKGPYKTSPLLTFYTLFGPCGLRTRLLYLLHQVHKFNLHIKHITETQLLLSTWEHVRKLQKSSFYIPKVFNTV